ncbi:MAG: ATP-binding protein, partial [Rubrobacteraceae bacterium]
VYILTEAPPGVDADLSLKPGFAVYLPVYRKGEPQGTSDERRKALKGFVVGCFKMDGLLEGIFGSALDPTLDFEVYDGKNTSESNLLYDDDGVRRAGQGYPGYSSSSRIDVAGRNWTLFFSASPEFGRDATSRLPLFVLLTGVATSFLLFVVVWMLVRSRDRAERASEDLEDANRELEGTNSELEAFSYSVSHDLRAPLRTIDGFSQILLEDYGDSLDAEGEDYLNRVRAASQHMGVLIDDLLDLSRVTRSPLRRERVDLSEMAKNIAGELRRVQPDRDIDFVIEESLIVQGDANLLSVALRNLLGNAWRFTSRKPGARVEFGADRNPGPGFLAPVYFVRDNGAGFEMAYAQRLFGAFQRLHHSDEFEGTGIGLATVQRIIHRHGGRVWAEGEPGRGATFHFTLGTGARQSAEPLPRKAEVA